MRFLVDEYECTGPAVAQWLLQNGHDVFSVYDEAPGSEDEAVMQRAFAEERIEVGARLSADEVAHWDRLAARFDLQRVNHSEAYSENGVHTNMAESFFSRLRRMIRGQHHAVSGKYLGAYAGHAAWLEDHSLESNGDLADRLIGAALGAPVSRLWSGYWQRPAT